MREMFQSRLFRRLFFTYILVIFTCLAVYMVFISYENHRITEFQIDRRSEIQLDELEAILDKRIVNAQNIVQNLSYSTALKQLYLNSRLGTQVDSYSLLSIQSELKNTVTSGGLSVYKTIIFLNDSDKAYSSSGVIGLNKPFSLEQTEYPCLMLGTLNDVFGFECNRYSFQKEYLLYCDAYTYQNGSKIGTICILFDMKNLQNEFAEAINDGYGCCVFYNGEQLLSVGETEGRTYLAQSEHCEGLTCQVFASENVPVEGNGIYYLLLGLMIVISLGFVWLAYWESRKYYMPIDRLEQMVKGEEIADGADDIRAGGGKEQDEMYSIISGIRSLIGEKNGYRERMQEIAPYAKTGVLHSIITGNMEEENIRTLSQKEYMYLIKPYFIAAVVNLAWADKKPDMEQRKQNLKSLLQTMDEAFSTDEIYIVHYFRDICNVFLIANLEKDEPMDDLFYRIHKYLSEAMEKDGCIVTMGVDMPRDDINELQGACEGAIMALDGILTDGRGEVYFLEAQDERHVEYYFPGNFKEKLKKYLEKGEEEAIRDMLFDIYQKNWDMAGTPQMYRALIDEVHLGILKTLREVTEFKTTYTNIEKYNGLATLREVFDYYERALCSIADSLHKNRQQAQKESCLEDDIIKYMDENCYDPALSLQSLSEHFKVSDKYLSILCKKRYDMTYLQYIQNKRIKRAAELLAKQEYSLTEVAAMCGYTSQLTFRRNFKSIMGVNPSDYPQDAQQKQ